MSGAPVGDAVASAAGVRPIVALDVPSLADARPLVDALGDACDFYKVGLELYAADGPRVVEWLREAGKEVFVDLKAHDIPNTVRGVARSVAASGASLLTVHAIGGVTMLEAAVEGAGSGCGILAVTVLTSFDLAGLRSASGHEVASVEGEVLRRAGLASAAGCHGVVCSGHEVAAVVAAHPALRPLVPGIRLAGGATHDQARVATPGAAARAGARYLVLGRAVTAAPDPVAAMRLVRAELAGPEGRRPVDL